MDNTKRRATWSTTNDELSRMGVMTGYIEYDAWDKENLFYPDEKYHAALYKLGFEPIAGFYLHDNGEGEGEVTWSFTDE